MTVSGCLYLSIYLSVCLCLCVFGTLKRANCQKWRRRRSEEMSHADGDRDALTLCKWTLKMTCLVVFLKIIDIIASYVNPWARGCQTSVRGGRSGAATAPPPPMPLSSLTLGSCTMLMLTVSCWSCVVCRWSHRWRPSHHAGVAVTVFSQGVIDITRPPLLLLLLAVMRMMKMTLCWPCLMDL